MRHTYLDGYDATAFPMPAQVENIAAAAGKVSLELHARDESERLVLLLEADDAARLSGQLLRAAKGARAA